MLNAYSKTSWKLWIRILLKALYILSFHRVLCSSDVFKPKSGRCRTLPVFLTFLLSRFSFYINNLWRPCDTHIPVPQSDQPQRTLCSPQTAKSGRCRSVDWWENRTCLDSALGDALFLSTGLDTTGHNLGNHLSPGLSVSHINFILVCILKIKADISQL